MFNQYYSSLVIGLIISVPEFVKFCAHTCPTYWLDGTQCSPVDDCINKASMELEYLEYECGL